MLKQRAIFIGDIRFNNCPVFELNEKNGYYEMLKDTLFRYKKEIVYEDDDWLLFVVDTDEDIARFVSK